MNQVRLSGQAVDIVVNHELRLTVLDKEGQQLWESSKAQTPTAVIRAGDAEPRTLPLASAAEVSLSAFAEGNYQGQAVRLSGFEGADAVVELVFALDAAADELLIQAEQVGGTDTVVSIEHLYRFEKPVADGGYLVLPHGSGYLIAADCPDELPGEGPKSGPIGARWTLPMFGLVRGEHGMCIIVETWWDCDVAADHVPGSSSALDFNWLGSLGKLAYARRMLLRFSEGMDYVAMAKLYRERARQQGLLRTLEEKATQTPLIRRYINSVLLRWPAWNDQEGPAVLTDIRKLQEMGFEIVFFYPKWAGTGYAPGDVATTPTTGLWQGFLLDEPVPGGWQTLVDLADTVSALGCPIQGFIAPRRQVPDGPEYDEARWALDGEGQPGPDLSVHGAMEQAQWALDNIEDKGLKFGSLYYDGYSAYGPLPEDFSPAHPVTRRQTFEVQNEVFAETRRRGIMPGAELARFWCMSDCDYFFFDGNWSSDRLVNTPLQGAPAPAGEPVPLFQLVFHDCYIAGFSGGGYSAYSPGYDWWADRTPRLYELLFACMPAYNWLPGGGEVPLDWQDPATEQRLAWLKRWSAFYGAVATSEMVSHQFLSADRKRQRLEFANGVVAEFDMAANQFRVEGVPDFSGEWEKPEEL